jgi:hypothetical protein
LFDIAKKQNKSRCGKVGDANLRKMIIFAGEKRRNMESTTINTDSIIQRITILVTQLATNQQQELEKQLKLMLLWEEARRLDGSVEKNNITMKEIVEEVKKVRNGQ